MLLELLWLRSRGEMCIFFSLPERTVSKQRGRRLSRSLNPAVLDVYPKKKFKVTPVGSASPDRSSPKVECRPHEREKRIRQDRAQDEIRYILPFLSLDCPQL